MITGNHLVKLPIVTEINQKIIEKKKFKLDIRKYPNSGSF